MRAIADNWLRKALTEDKLIDDCIFRGSHGRKPHYQFSILTLSPLAHHKWPTFLLRFYRSLVPIETTRMIGGADAGETHAPAA